PKPVPCPSAIRRTTALSESRRAAVTCLASAPASLSVSKKPRSLTDTNRPAPIAPRCRVSISLSLNTSLIRTPPRGDRDLRRKSTRCGRDVPASETEAPSWPQGAFKLSRGGHLTLNASSTVAPGTRGDPRRHRGVAGDRESPGEN